MVRCRRPDATSTTASSPAQRPVLQRPVHHACQYHRRDEQHGRLQRARLRRLQQLDRHATSATRSSRGPIRLRSDDAYQMCLATNINNLSTQGYSNVGAPWIYGYHSTTSYWHSGPPNTRSCMFPPSRISTTAEQPPPRRSQRGPGRRLGAVHQDHDQYPDLAAVLVPATSARSSAPTPTRRPAADCSQTMYPGNMPCAGRYARSGLVACGLIWISCRLRAGGAAPADADAGARGASRRARRLEGGREAGRSSKGGRRRSMSRTWTGGRVPAVGYQADARGQARRLRHELSRRPGTEGDPRGSPSRRNVIYTVTTAPGTAGLSTRGLRARLGSVGNRLIGCSASTGFEKACPIGARKAPATTFRSGL